MVHAENVPQSAKPEGQLLAAMGLRRGGIAPTILKRFGMDLSKIDPPIDGHPLTEPYEPPIW